MSQAGVVTAIFSKFETNPLARVIAFFTEGNDSDVP